MTVELPRPLIQERSSPSTVTHTDWHRVADDVWTKALNYLVTLMDSMSFTYREAKATLSLPQTNALAHLANIAPIDVGSVLIGITKQQWVYDLHGANGWIGGVRVVSPADCRYELSRPLLLRCVSTPYGSLGQLFQRSLCVAVEPLDGVRGPEDPAKLRVAMDWLHTAGLAKPLWTGAILELGDPERSQAAPTPD